MISQDDVNVLTIFSKRVFSRRAPTHPANEIINRTRPMTRMMIVASNKRS